MNLNKLLLQWIAVFAIFFTVSLWGDGGTNDSCNGEQISELHNISVTTSRTETGTLSNNTNPTPDDNDDYYYFSPGVAGTLSYSYTSGNSTDFYIATTGCGQDKKVNNGTSYSTHTLSVSSTDTVYIRVKRESNDPTTTYEIPMTFTVAAQTPPLLSSSVPDLSLSVGNAMTALDFDDYFTPTDGDAITYTLTGTLPAGLSYNATTHEISGTPTSSTASTTFTISAADNDGTTTDTFTITVTTAAVDSTGGRNFTLRKDIKLYGDVSVIGNTVLCLKDNSGACIESPNNTSNDDVDLQTASSSYSTLSFPSGVTGANVQYARLYWQGRQTRTTSSSTWSTTEKNSAKSISLRYGNSGTFSSISADFGDFAQIRVGSDYIKIYSAGADVTDFVKNAGGGEYFVENLYTSTGNSSDGLGNYGAWVLVVVYDIPNAAQFKNVSVFDGYKIVPGDGTNIDFQVSGLFTPKAPATVESKLYVFAGEGDKYLSDTSDTIQMSGLLYNTTYTSLGTMDSRIDVSGTRSPNLTNNNGIDIQEYNVGTANGGSGIITNSENGARFRFTSGMDIFFPSLAVFSTDLYVPDICYDYSFSQNNRFFPHDASATAHIHGYLLNTEPLKTQLMFRNREAGTEAKNISIRIQNIDSTNQLEFYTDSQLDLKKTLPDAYYYYTVPSADITTNSDSTLAFNWVTSTAVLGYNQSVFAAFNLKPLTSGQIDVPLVMYMNYDFTLDNQTYSMTNQKLDERIPRCTPTPTAYNPVEWIFNVVDGNLNPGIPAEGVTNLKYNLPTQVANRPANIKVVSFDPTQLNRVKAINGMVAIELIDVAGYLDTESSCDDPNSAISSRAWLQLGDIDQNVTTATLTAADFNTGLNAGVTVESFFGSVRENVAYRISYNIADDNGSIKFDSMDGAEGKKYHLVNFPTYGGNVCASDIDGNPNSQDMVPQYCGDNGTSYASGMTPAELRTCMECIYGLKTKSVCSRDNFSIRPEGFKIKIQDSAGPLLVPYDANLSAGYMYQFDVNSTSHTSNNATSGYTSWFSGSNPDQYVKLSWEPNGRTVTGCNDTTSPNIDFYFANGQIVAQDRNHDNVGRYQLQMRDSLWTTVDQAPAGYTSPLHHDDATNWISGNDCASGSAVPLYNTGISYSANMVGCTISSSHTNLQLSETFNDYNLTFRPHHFNPALEFKRGATFNSSLIGVNSWIYMNDVHVDPVMGARYMGAVKAEGATSGALNNFVKDCYAEPINLDVNLTFPTTAGLPIWKYRFQETNTTSQIWNDVNGTIASPVTNSSFGLLTLPASSFLKDQNGSVTMKLTLNFDRNQTVAVNPIEVGLQNLQLKCQTASDCVSLAEMTTSHLPDANLTTDANITHLYGRIIPRDIRVFGNVPFTANGWYEVYNTPSLIGSTLPASKNDAIWYINTQHDDDNDGNGDVTVVHPNTLALPTNSNMPIPPNTGTETYSFGSIGLSNIPYSGKAHINTDPWLWYGLSALGYADPGFNVDGTTDGTVNADDCIHHPCFNINVVPDIGATGSAKSTNEATKASKKSSEGSGTWKSTSDYAPAIR